MHDSQGCGESVAVIDPKLQTGQHSQEAHTPDATDDREKASASVSAEHDLESEPFSS